MLITTNSGPFKLLELEVAGLGLGSFTALHISDIHFAPGQRAKAGFLADLAGLKPDLSVNTGDNLGHAKALNPLLRALEPLLEVPGVFVNGSNDYRSPKPKNPLSYFAGPSKVTTDRNDLDTARMMREFEGAGWHNLNNQMAKVEVSGRELNFAGVDDPHENLDDFGKLSQADIAVAHAPYLRVIKGFTELDAKLLFAGHTHGGQICLPGGKALVTNCDLPTENAQGLSSWEFEANEIALHVSGGLGASIYSPVRLFCPPSATLIRFS